MKNLQTITLATSLLMAIPSWAGYAMVNGMPAVSYGANAAMGATLADKLATIGVNAKIGADIMRAVAKSSAVRFLGKSIIWAAPLLVASDTGLFDESVPKILVNGDGATIRLSGPDMDAVHKPSLIFPTGSWINVIQAMGYPAAAAYVGSCQKANDCARYLRTYQWACPEANKACTPPMQTVDASGYTSQSSMALGYVGNPPVYNHVIIAELLPPRMLTQVAYISKPINNSTEAASVLPDSRGNDQINYGILSAALNASIQDAIRANPGLAWPSELTKSGAISSGDVKAAGIPVTLTVAVSPVAVDQNSQWPPGWADARPGTIYWDPAIATPGAGTGAGTGAATGPVDLGADPQTPAPTLENIPTAEMILSPLLGMFPDLRGFQLPSHASACPRPGFSIWGESFTFTAHCDLFEDNKALIYGAFVAAWALTALFIILSA